MAPSDAQQSARTTGTDDAYADLMFLGTGVSTALPALSCILKSKGCPVCERGFLDPLDPNCRSNVSVIVRYRGREGDPDPGITILIDAGKTLRTAALRWFRKFGVKGIDALLLTHGHADAVGGIDDLRDLQVVVPRIDGKGHVVSFAIENALPIYLNQDTFDTCKGAYPYLVPELRRRDDVPRRVASLHWRVIDNATPFAVRGKGQAVQVTPIPVLHGGQYVCLGFAFGQGRCARRRVHPLFPSLDWH